MRVAQHAFYVAVWYISTILGYDLPSQLTWRAFSLAWPPFCSDTAVAMWVRTCERDYYPQEPALRDLYMSVLLKQGMSQVGQTTIQAEAKSPVQEYNLVSPAEAALQCLLGGA